MDEIQIDEIVREPEEVIPEIMNQIPNAEDERRNNIQIFQIFNHR